MLIREILTKNIYLNNIKRPCHHDVEQGDGVYYPKK